MDVADEAHRTPMRFTQRMETTVLIPHVTIMSLIHLRSVTDRTTQSPAPKPGFNTV